MKQIRWGLRDGINVTEYANVEISGEEMSEIRYRLLMEKRR